jgi:hypothetical protein
VKKQGYKSMGKMQSTPLPKTAMPAGKVKKKGKTKK